MANAKAKIWSGHIALGYCKKCKTDIISSRGGIFQSCPCGKSFIDQERFSGLYVRLGGNAVFVEQICPKDCKIKEHRKRND